MFKIYKLNWIIFFFSGIITLWCHFLNSFLNIRFVDSPKHCHCLRLWVTDKTFQNLWWNILLKESRVNEWLPVMLYKCTHGSNLKVCGWNPEVWLLKSVLSEFFWKMWFQVEDWIRILLTREKCNLCEDVFFLVSAPYHFFYLLTDEWLICVLRAQCMISKSNVKLCSMRWYVCRYFFKF